MLLRDDDKPSSPHDEKEEVAPETRIDEPRTVTDMPKPEGAENASGTTPSSESGGAAVDSVDSGSWKEQVDLSHIRHSSLRRRIMSFLSKHEAMFSGDLGTVSAVKHHIELKPGTAPIRQQPYRAGPEKRESIREQIEYQLKAGVIEPAQSEWASPVLLAPKKDGTMRFCIDFRRLNAATIPDTYPLPRMDDCIDSLSHAKVFSMLDALWGCWQIPIANLAT